MFLEMTKAPGLQGERSALLAFVERFRSLAGALEAVSLCLLRIPGTLEGESSVDNNLAFRIANAGGAVLALGSSMPSAGGAGESPDESSFLRQATHFCALLDYLIEMERTGQGRALSVLRAGVLKPEVILGMLKRLCCHPGLEDEPGEWACCAVLCC